MKRASPLDPNARIRRYRLRWFSPTWNEYQGRSYALYANAVVIAKRLATQGLEVELWDALSNAPSEVFR